MATEQRIPGRGGSTTIISDSFAPFGEVSVGPPVRQEDPSTYAPRDLEEAQVLRRYSWTPEDLQAASLIGFPAPVWSGYKTTLFSWRYEVIRRWSEQHLLEWEARIRSAAGSLPRK
jgi:hypothetical protein